MRQRRVLTALAIPLVLAFVAASCGSDDSSSDATTAPDGTEATEEETTDGTEAPVEAPEDVDTSIVENTEEVVMGGSVIMGLEAEATGLRPWEDSCANRLLQHHADDLRPVDGRTGRAAATARTWPRASSRTRTSRSGR